MRRPILFLAVMAVCFAVAADGSLAQQSQLPGNGPASASSDQAIDCGWPFVRGCTFDGRSQATRIADAWPDVGPPVLWTRELGQGYSAFVSAAIDTSV